MSDRLAKLEAVAQAARRVVQNAKDNKGQAVSADRPERSVIALGPGPYFSLKWAVEELDATPPSPPQPKELCSVCGQPDSNWQHSTPGGTHAFKPAQASKALADYLSAANVATNSRIMAHGEGHGKPATKSNSPTKE